MSQTHANPDEVVTPPGRREIFRDLAVGWLSLAIACVLGFFHLNQGGRLHDDYGAEPGPALLPDMLLICLAVAGLLLLVRGILAKMALNKQLAVNAVTVELPLDTDSESGNEPIWAARVLAISVVACLLYPYSGFGISAVLVGVGVCSLLAYQEKRSLFRASVEGFLVTAFLYSVFRFVLSVPLT